MYEFGRIRFTDMLPELSLSMKISFYLNLHLHILHASIIILFKY